MRINLAKTVAFSLTAAFLLSGCNIYRQMVIPTPYTPTVNTETVTQEQPIVDNSTVTPKETEQTQQVTPIKKNPIKQTNKTIVQRIPFPEAEYQSLAKTGSGTVTGHIYLVTKDGTKIYGKETRLYLNPETSYSTQWYKESYLGGAKMSKVDPRLYNYLKFTTSDKNGKFEFLNVPSGSYYLIGVVKCGQQCGYSKVKSIRIAKKISVFGSDTVNVDLTK